MIPLLFLAIPTINALADAAAQAPQAQQMTAQQAKNREFILKNYPPGARQRGEQGRVAFTVMIEPDGTLTQCEVTESSGYSGLDKETCEIMVRYGQLKPVVGADGRSIRAKQNGFITWKLPDETQAVAAAAPPKTMEKPDEIICKKSQKTGSLIAATRQCLTRSEWALQERMAREDIERIQGKGHYAEGN